MRTARTIFAISLAVALLLANHSAPLFADITAGTNTSLVVPPKPPDYQFDLSANVGSGPISQGTDITYTITYGASISAALTTNFTLTADFSNDTTDGVTHVTDYVFNSATNAYGGATPIVDLVNRKITWNISQMPPGNIDQIVTFRLKTNSNYTGSNQIPIVVSTNFANQYVSLQKSLTITYGFHIFPSSPTSTPTPTPVPSITPTPPIPFIQPLAISAVQITEISANSLTLSIATSRKTRLRAFYGLSPTVRLQDISDTSLSTLHILQLTGLSPATKYYLQLTATDENYNSVTSDILIIQTAKSSAPLVINPNEATLVGSGNLIATQTLSGFSKTLLSSNQVYSIALHLPPASLKSIAAVVRNKVLGVNTFTAAPSENIWSVPLIEKSPGLYVTQLAAPTTPGSYEVFIHAQDNNGNIIQAKIAEVIVYGPLTVIDATTKKPIDHARIFIYEYNTALHRYESDLYSQTQENPTFTDTNGHTNLTTGEGEYKVFVSQYGYRAKTLIFSLNATHTSLPTVELQPIGFSVIETLQDSTQTISDFGGQLFADVQNISGTSRFFKIVSTLVVLSLIFITFLLFLIRTRLSLMVIPLFIKHHATKNGSVHGQLLDEITRKGIALAAIAVCKKDTQEVLATTISNAKGIFYLNSAWVSSDNILRVLAQGYGPNEFAINDDLFPAVIYLHHNGVGGPLHNPFVANIFDFVGMLFETVLILSLIFEIFFIRTIGLWGIIFTLISLGNLLLYYFYQKEKTS